MKRAVIIYLLLFMGISAGYVYAQKSQEYNASGGTLEVEAGNIFVIELKSNQVIGLKWRLASPLDTDILKLVSVEFVRSTARIIGIPGKETWTFKALKPGEVTIYLKYSRSPSTKVASEEEKVYIVTVTEPSKQKKQSE
ncbi:MAG: protease inhibitor I42 family protein [Candidatus Omnitrophota bacterium]